MRVLNDKISKAMRARKEIWLGILINVQQGMYSMKGINFYYGILGTDLLLLKH